MGEGFLHGCVCVCVRTDINTCVLVCFPPRRLCVYVVFVSFLFPSFFFVAQREHQRVPTSELLTFRGKHKLCLLKEQLWEVKLAQSGRVVGWGGSNTTSSARRREQKAGIINCTCHVTVCHVVFNCTRGGRREVPLKREACFPPCSHTADEFCHLIN